MAIAALALPTISKLFGEDFDITDLVIKLGGLLLNSAPVIMVMGNVMVLVQWNLEHLVVYKDPHGKWKLDRISTMDTSNTSDLAKTPLSAPVMSTAIRMLDAGADTAEIGAKTMQDYLNTLRESGGVGAMLQLLFGKGG